MENFSDKTFIIFVGFKVELKHFSKIYYHGISFKGGAIELIHEIH